MPPKKITAWDVQALLRKRYAAPAWAYLEELRNSTGYIGTPRTADGLAMSLWPSRGLSVHGFEVKVSRSDVVKELKTPAKAEAIMKYCDHWWLVLGDAKLIEPGELPPTWGLMVVRGKSQLRAVTEAPKLEAKPLDRGFIASVLRNFEQSYVPARVHRELKDDIDGTIRAEVRENAAADFKRENDRLARLLDGANRRAEKSDALIREFTEKSGVHLSEWDLGNIADAVSLVRTCNTNHLRNRLVSIAKDGKAVQAYAETALATLDTYEEKKQ